VPHNLNQIVAQLFRIACALTRQANIATDDWTFGGGTAMMLQIDHRESHDVDIFLSDPQLLPFLDPQTHDFKLDIRPTACRGDGAKSIKMVFETGEIDFIVAQALTSSPATRATVEGESVLLETIPEIITKKIYHRGPASCRETFSTSQQQVNDTKLRSFKNYEAIPGK
jgi:hypothetical protein